MRLCRGNFKMFFRFKRIPVFSYPIDSDFIICQYTKYLREVLKLKFESLPFNKQFENQP